MKFLFWQYDILFWHTFRMFIKLEKPRFLRYFQQFIENVQCENCIRSDPLDICFLISPSANQLCIDIAFFSITNIEQQRSTSDVSRV